MTATMKNTFTSLQEEFTNIGLHFFVSECITVRQQIMISTESMKLAGWSNGLNEWIKDYLSILTEDLDRMLAANNAGVAMSGLTAHLNIAHNLTGSDPNVRQPTQNQIRNVGLRSICQLLDRLAVQVTHFDSRFMIAGINPTEHAQAETFLTYAFSICELHGGNNNNRELISGVLPRDLDDGFNYNGEFDVNFGTLDVGDMAIAEGFRVNDQGNQPANVVQNRPGPAPGTPQQATARRNPGQNSPSGSNQNR